MTSVRWIKGGAAPLALLVAACGGDARADGSPESDGYVRVINVEVQPLEAGPFTELIRVTGTVEAFRDVTVAAEESGPIVELFVEKGTAVRAGQPIARIDDRVLRAQVDQARAQAALAGEVWERRRRLFEEDRVGSEVAYLEARYGAEQAAASLQALEERLARTVVRAPVEGILDSRNVEVGSMVGPGTPVARIVDLDPVKVSGGVPERFSPDVRRGTMATVTFDVFPDRTFEGAITYVGSTVSPSNRTFAVELRLPNPGGTIKPEMVANVSVVRRTLEEVVVVPQEALVRLEQGFAAFVAAERDGRAVAEVRPVTLGPSQRNVVVVESGLEPGDRLIVVGQKQVANGDRIQVVAEREGGSR